MPQKVYTFGFIVGTTIPKSVKCIRSATKIKKPWAFIGAPCMNPTILGLWAQGFLKKVPALPQHGTVMGNTSPNHTSNS